MMKLLTHIAKNTQHSLGWKYSLFLPFATCITAIVLVFYPTQNACQEARLLQRLLHSAAPDVLSICDNRLWFISGAVFLAVGYTVALSLLVKHID